MRTNFKQGLPAAHGSAQAGLAPVVIIIIALVVIGGGTFAIKKAADSTKATEEKAKQEQAAKDSAAQAEAAAAAEATKAARVLHIKLDEQNKSGQKGEATITQVGTSTVKVIVNITGKPSGVAQPAHIHLGSCPNPGAVKYPLTSVGKGASQTELPMTLDQLLSELPLAINVHKSAADIKTYTSCGDLKAENIKSAEATPAAPEKTADVTPKSTSVIYSASGFSPKTITIKKGETVVFENKTGNRVSVASDVHPTHLLYPEFDQYKTDQRGKDEFRFTFDKVGTWGYHDHLNAGMVGTVVVTE